MKTGRRKTTILLNHDIVLWLVHGLQQLDDIDEEQRDATAKLLWNADTVTLTLGLDPPCSLAARHARSLESPETGS
jgi:hypothetical protein